MNETERKQLNAEKARQKAKLAQNMKVIDPEIEIEFQNIEDPPSDGKPSPAFSFVFQTPKGIILSFKESRQEGIPDTALRHGQSYTLPLSVVEHINNLKRPIYGQKVIPDPLTGAPKVINYIAGYRQRFTCVPTNMRNFLQAESGGDEGLSKAKRQYKKSKADNDLDKANSELAGLGNE